MSFFCIAMVIDVTTATIITSIIVSINISIVTFIVVRTDLDA